MTSWICNRDNRPLQIIPSHPHFALMLRLPICAEPTYHPDLPTEARRPAVKLADEVMEAGGLALLHEARAAVVTVPMQ